MKKVSLFLGLAVLLVSFPVNASSLPIDDFSSEKTEVYNEYKDDPQFIMMLDECGEAYASQFLDDVLQVRREEMRRGGGGNICYQYVKNIKQPEKYDCGTTTVLQTLYGLGCEDNVPGDTDEAKVDKLDTVYKIKEQKETIVWQIPVMLNTYSDRTYVFEEVTTMTQDGFEDKIAASLTNCRPVILHAKTEYIGYYNGHESGHYISLDYVNRTTDKVRLVDCNYNDAYFGIHDNINLSEAYAAVHEVAGRYIIR